MKGIITVSSILDDGTIFTLILPARRIAYTSAPAMSDARETTSDLSPPVRELPPGMSTPSHWSATAR